MSWRLFRRIEYPGSMGFVFYNVGINSWAYCDSVIIVIISFVGSCILVGYHTAGGSTHSRSKSERCPRLIVSVIIVVIDQWTSHYGIVRWILVIIISLVKRIATADGPRLCSVVVILVIMLRSAVDEI